MKVIKREFVDWKKTGRKLEMLRQDNIELRRKVCRALKHDDGNCVGDCAACEFEMDNHISRNELSKVFDVSESVIYNWENGKTVVDYDDLLFYAKLADLDISDIVVLG